ncbi:hypothetical protein KOI35_22265 [Actinoplanes bogorensis]|uniref:HTH cro/C1-type domain-containing protein n=1 Tax=Paractinoplanes bogorensis TaxID=1610840 RepID=A0ABS5YS12_9ACTN|nr:hypothetical protein [Actinoplanes bogorensis]MBU2666230.1 hypothetical protein [Actinoplanes bogorensis]
MTSMPVFGTRLARLLEHRATSAADLAQSAGIPAERLDAVLGGADPDEPLLRHLAPALGLHTSDLFLFAARAVPDDLAPAELHGPWHVGTLVIWDAYGLDAQRRERLRHFVDGLPRRETVRTQPFLSDWNEATPGVILRRLLTNRNLLLDARLLRALGGGPYVSTSTYAIDFRRRPEPRAEFVNAVARTVGIPIGDLAALLGLEVAEVPWSLKHEWPSDLVELAWAARRLDDEQHRAAMDYAEALERGAA